MSSSSSWATKFEKKLKALTEGGASKESIQTLATWMVFNRKHVSAFSQVLLSLPDLTSAASATVAVGVPTASITITSKQVLYWQLIHQVLLSNKEDHDKWERAMEMRITLGESVILVALPNLCSNNNNNTDDDETSTTATIMDLVEGMIKEWDQHNVFGGPTLTGQIKRILLTAKSTKSTPALTTTTTNATTKFPPTDANVVVAVVADAQPAADPSVVDAQQAATKVPPKEESSPRGNVSSSPSSSPPQPPPTPSPGRKQPPQQPQNHQRRESMSSVHSEQQSVPVEYNFDNSEIPFGVVEPKEFLDPCKAVATLQIARDIRHDTPVLLHGLLSNLPKDIQDFVSALSLQHSPHSDQSTLSVVPPVEELEESTIQDYSRRIPAELLEMDWAEQIQTIQTFQDIIRRQRQARQKLIYLLIKSRCQLGSREAAQLFHQLDMTTMKALIIKKQLLIDALELEGMDSVVMEDKTQEKLLDEALSDLSPLTWFDPKYDDQDATSSAKRQKFE